MTASLSIPRGEVIIRAAGQADAGRVFELRLEALRRHPEAFAADVELTAAKGVPDWEQRIASFASEETGAIIIACAGEEVVGMSGIVRGSWPKIRHNSTLWGVYVNADWRGYRIAEAIIEGCVSWAANHEVCVVMLGVNISNIDAIRAYARCGFSVYGVQPKAIYFDGVYYDELLMARKL